MKHVKGKKHETYYYQYLQLYKTLQTIEWT